MKKIMIQKITQNNWNFWTVNLIMRAKKIVNQSSDFPVRRTGSYRHKKALLTGHCSRHTHTFFGIDHDLHFQSLASCGHEHIGLHVQKVDDKGRFKQSGSKVSKRTDALRSRPTFPRCPACHTRVRTCMTVYLTTYTKAFTYDSIVTRPVEMVRGVNAKYLWLSGSALFVWAQAVLCCVAVCGNYTLR